MLYSALKWLDYIFVFVRRRSFLTPERWTLCVYFCRLYVLLASLSPEEAANSSQFPTIYVYIYIWSNSAFYPPPSMKMAHSDCFFSVYLISFLHHNVTYLNSAWEEVSLPLTETIWKHLRVSSPFVFLVSAWFAVSVITHKSYLPHKNHDTTHLRLAVCSEKWI